MYDIFYWLHKVFYSILPDKNTKWATSALNIWYDSMLLKSLSKEDFNESNSYY